MSEQGRAGQGQVRGWGRIGNRYQPRNNDKYGRGYARKNDNQEMKFTPYYVGKQQGATFDTVRDHLLLQMQKTFKDGKDIVQALRDNVDDLGSARPVRSISSKVDDAENKTEQDGFDIDYKEEIRL